MTELEKKKEYFKDQNTLVLKCATAREPKEQLAYAKALWAFIANEKKYYMKTENLIRDLIDKLSDAAIVIKNYDDWMDCLEIAMGKDRDRIIQTAKLEQEAIKKYLYRRNKKE